ncbi:MAG: molybdenum cofactor biosynthesis protein [Deltaproteobacteria bacterium]|nr:MAG: molybdenum cofactor biosynthesis protein [Deltaproteobacteria bacterium]
MVFDFAVLTLSDKGARGEREDTSGKNLIGILEKAGYRKVYYEVIPDRQQLIAETLIKLCDMEIPLIVTTGGTGIAPTDVTPEAMDEVVEKEVPGIAELMRLESLKITKRACISRGKAGIRGKSLIINLPGSKKAAEENLLAVVDVLQHGLEKMLGDQSDCGR